MSAARTHFSKAIAVLPPHLGVGFTAYQLTGDQAEWRRDFGQGACFQSLLVTQLADGGIAVHQAIFSAEEHCIARAKPVYAVQVSEAVWTALARADELVKDAWDEMCRVAPILRGPLASHPAPRAILRSIVTEVESMRGSSPAGFGSDNVTFGPFPTGDTDVPGRPGYFVGWDRLATKIDAAKTALGIEGRERTPKRPLPA